MSSDTWQVAELQAVGVKVADCEHKTPPDAGEGYAYVAIPNVVDGRLDLQRVRRITEAHYDEWTRRTRPKGGDVIVTRRGRVGDTAIIPEGLRCAIGQNLVILRSDGAHVDQRYLRWAVRGPAWWREVDRLRNVGAVFDSLNVRDIARLRLPFPCLDEQRRIASFLNTLDDKIESNERSRRAVLVVAGTAFDRMAASATGTRTLGDLGTIRGGGTPKSSEPSYWEPSEIAWITPRDMTALAGSPVIWRGERDVSELGLQKSSAKLLPAGTVLYTSRASLGMIAIAQLVMATNQGFITIEPAEDVSSEFVYFTLCSQRERIAAKANGSTFLEVNKTNFKAVEFPMPDGAVRREFDAVAKPAFELISGLARETGQLRAIRDELLPKLVSGKIRVPAAEEVVEAGDNAALGEAAA